MKKDRYDIIWSYIMTHLISAGAAFIVGYCFMGSCREPFQWSDVNWNVVFGIYIVLDIFFDLIVLFWKDDDN